LEALKAFATGNEERAKGNAFESLALYKRAIELLDEASEISNRLRDYRQWGESAALRAWTSYLVADFEDYVADHIVVHPAWFTAGPCFGNSKGACLSPGHEDIALVFLRSNVAGVTPAPIAGAGYLDTLNPKTATFTVVGYGTDRYITGSAAAPNPIVIFDGIRSYRDVTAIPAKDAFPDRFYKITKGVCFGDSGGPLFHNGTVVAINTWTFSWRCDGPNLEYRVDSAIAQAFLDANL
jgi:hypothetical protein